MHTLVCIFLLFERFPFKSNNLIGYLIAAILEYILIGWEYFVIACNVGLFIGMFRIAISVTKETQRILQSINDEANANTTANQSNKLKILLFEHIHAHTAIKRFSTI